jgi:hypothetical protein
VEDYRKGKWLGRLTVFDDQFYSTSGNVMNVWVSRHDGTTATIEHTVNIMPLASRTFLAVHSGQLLCFFHDSGISLRVARKVGDCWSEPYHLGTSWRQPSAASLNGRLHLLTYTHDGPPSCTPSTASSCPIPPPCSRDPQRDRGASRPCAGG